MLVHEDVDVRSGTVLMGCVRVGPWIPGDRAQIESQEQFNKTSPDLGVGNSWDETWKAWEVPVCEPARQLGSQKSKLAHTTCEHSRSVMRIPTGFVVSRPIGRAEC